MNIPDEANIQIGYARVSTDGQNLDLQERALNEAGCAIIYSDKASGVLNGRQGLDRAIRRCRSGDVLVVWKLDLMGLVEQLRIKDIGLRVLTGQGAMIDTTRPEGRMIFAIFATLAEFERDLIRERTRAGMEAAKRRGVHCGRPSKLTSAMIERTRQSVRNGERIAIIAQRLGVHETTLRKALKKSV